MCKFTQQIGRNSRAGSQIAPGHTALGEGVRVHWARPGTALCHLAPHWPWLWTRPPLSAMTLKPVPRKLLLTVHITSSVGWFGTVVGFLALAVTGLASDDAQVVRSVYLAMELIARYAIVPFCLASLFTGIASSLASEWGLFRHYWIVMKLLITLISTIGLLVHLQPIHYLSVAAAENALSRSHLQMQTQLVVVSSAALLALLVATVLSVFKPKGLTPYGWHRKIKNESRVRQ